MSETEDRWYVEIAGKVEMMSLDELVEAYEAGTISAKTLVTEVGESEWHTLAEVADLPEEEEAAPQSVRMPAPPVATAPVRAAAPQSFPPASRESAWPPAAAWSQAPAPTRSVPPSMAPSSVGPLSTAPVVHDLDLGSLDDMQFKRSKGKTAFVAFAAIAVLGAGGFGISRASSAASVAAVPVPAAAALAAPSPASLGDWKTPLNPVAAAPAAPTPAPAATEEKATDSRLSEDAKAALAAKDKDMAAKKKAAKSSRPVRASSRRNSDSSSSGVFRSGGSADDPLNSKL
jgi:translation initiation factor IF-2